MAQSPISKPISRPMPAPGKTPRFNETALAIVGSLVVALVLAVVVAGNPLRATRLAYTDYSHTPAAGAEKASTTNAPATQGPRK